MKKALFFFAYSANIGLTTHLSRIFIDLYNLSKQNGIEAFIVADIKEQSPGLWRNLENNVPSDNIIKFKSIIEQRNLIEEKMSHYEFNIFHLQGLRNILNLKSILSKENVRSVITINSFSHGRKYQRFKFSLFFTYFINKYCDKAIFISPFSLSIFTGGTFLTKRNKIVHIPFCLPPYSIKKDEDKTKNQGIFQITYLAQFHKWKGQVKYLSTLCKFVKHYSNVRIILLGDGKELLRVRKIVKKNLLENKIICPGRLPYNEAISVLANSDVALFLSSSETFGHGALEPIMFDVPLISTRVGFAEYFIQDYINGLTFTSKKDLYHCLEFCIRYPKITKWMAENAKRIANQFFDYSSMLKGWINLYQSL